MNCGSILILWHTRAPLGLLCLGRFRHLRALSFLATAPSCLLNNRFLFHCPFFLRQFRRWNHLNLMCRRCLWNTTIVMICRYHIHILVPVTTNPSISRVFHRVCSVGHTNVSVVKCPICGR
ncbi:hypothetical protein V8G54_012903 [Vigna mungo]|uniref:Secreted protein n=1 Tax=Vigna mungo TaxID=3915 RepID=A0AAQ3NV60_VIGMU